MVTEEGVHNHRIKKEKEGEGIVRASSKKKPGAKQSFLHS